MFQKRLGILAILLALAWGTSGLAGVFADPLSGVSTAVAGEPDSYEQGPDIGDPPPPPPDPSPPPSSPPPGGDAVTVAKVLLNLLAQALGATV